MSVPTIRDDSGAILEALPNAVGALPDAASLGTTIFHPFSDVDNNRSQIQQLDAKTGSKTTQCLTH